METLITNGIQISVECFYQPRYSEPLSGKYLFTYEIEIENKSDFTVQLLRRHWFIFDSLNGVREVEGEGVVGQQPVLEPGSTHRYTSWCPLMSEIGRMDGIFLMERIDDKTEFQVLIPSFQLWADSKSN